MTAKGENRCFIFGAGEFDRPLVRPAAGDFVIAADGGYAYLRDLSLKPDVLLGDFDSLGEPPAGENILRYPAIKDDTDMGLAAKLGLEKGYREFILYGGTGGRLDHTIANFQVLTYLAHRGGIGYLIGGGNIITAFTNSTISFSEKNTGIFSMFCIGAPAEGVSIRGMKYELDRAVVTCDITLGASNEFIGEKSAITVASGTLLAMWEERNGLPEGYARIKDREDA